MEYIATGKTASDAPTETPITTITPRDKDRTSTRRSVGLILVGVGSAGVLLGLVLSLLVAILSVLVLLGGILCLCVKRHLGLVLAWVYGGIGLLSTTFLTGMRLLSLGNAVINTRAWLLICLPIDLLLIIAVVLTVRAIVRRRRH